MSRIGPAVRAAIGLGASQVAGQAVGLVTVLLLAARLGLVGFGEYAVVGALVFVANVGTTFGTDMVLVREIAAAGVVRRVAAAVVLQLALSLLAMAVLSLIAPLVLPTHPETATALRIMSVSLLPGALFAVSTSALRGRAMLRSYAAAGVVSSLVPAAAVLAFVPQDGGVLRAAVVALAAQGAVGVATWVFCVARVPGFALWPRTAVREVRDMLRDSARVGVLGLLGMAYQRLPVIVLGMATGPAAAGWFTCASRTVEASKTAHVGVFSAVYPALAAEHASRRTSAGRDLRWAWRLNLALGAGVTVLLLVLAPLLVGRLFGHAFAPSVTGLRILAASVIPSTIATYRSLELLAAHRETAIARVLLAGSTVLAAGLAGLVPALGWLGASWAVLIAETVQAGLMLATPVRAGERTPAVRGALSSVASGG